MDRVKNKQTLQLLIHIIGWGLLFGLPFFFFERGEQDYSWGRYLRYCVVPLSFMVVFYVNYCRLIDRYLFEKKVQKYIIANLLLIALVGVGQYGWQMLNHPVPPPGMQPWPWYMGFFFLLKDMLLLVLTGALSVAIKMTDNWYRTEAERVVIEKNRTEAELMNLKNQLNPHFLFNTLNNIYSLISFSPEKAQSAVHDLSRLLRYVLYENNQNFVSLDKEMDFVRNYIELMRIRLPKHVKLDTDIRVDGQHEVAPLLFITLIENAFKHGVSPVEDSFIRISIRKNGEHMLVCRIDNSYFPKGEQDKSGSGIGLENLQKRLSLLYPERYTLFTGREGKDYVAILNVPV